MATRGGAPIARSSAGAAPSASSIPAGFSVDPQRDELRAKLVEVAAAGALLGDLAERRDRGGVADDARGRDGSAVVVEREPACARRAARTRRGSARRRPRLGGEHRRDRLAVRRRRRGRGDALELLRQRHAPA